MIGIKTRKVNESWHLISGGFIVTAALSFYNNEFKLSVGIIVLIGGNTFEYFLKKWPIQKRL